MYRLFFVMVVLGLSSDAFAQVCKNGKCSLRQAGQAEVSSAFVASPAQPAFAPVRSAVAWAAERPVVQVAATPVAKACTVVSAARQKNILNRMRRRRAVRRGW